MKIVIIILVILQYSSSALAEDCLKWFLQSGLAAKAEDCEIKCVVTPVDMSSFSCPNQCSQLCSKTLPEHILAYVPRLTEGDKIIISKMPYESYKVFFAKEKVNELTGRIFKKAARKDESDAFRHFVWSALMAQEIGPAKAQMFLTAHEQDSTQSASEKAMDEFNNLQGISYYNNYAKDNKGKALELDKIEKEALNRLKRKKLKVLNPRFKEIPGGYYSK